MKVNNETIRFTVTYRPLNMFDDNIKYSLYVAFEMNGIFMITPGFCDLSLLNINNYAQLVNAPLAPSYSVSRMNCRGILDKFTKANNFLKSTGLVSSVAGLLPSKVGSTAANALRMAGYGYDDDDRGTTRMSGGQIIPPGSFYEKYYIKNLIKNISFYFLKL